MASRGMLARPHPNLYILGTVHIGSKSAQEAELLIETVQPTNVVVEIPPSRLKRMIQKKKEVPTSVSMAMENEERSNTVPNANTTNTNASVSKGGWIHAIHTFPALATAGYEKGGVSGLLFSTIILWSSLLKRSTTAGEEANSLPRRNEFEAAVMACRNRTRTLDANGNVNVNVNVNVIAADLEFEQLIQSISQNMTPTSWFQLGLTLIQQAIGIRPTDPVRRRRDESILEWEERRRNIDTARASRDHGRLTNPELDQVLVTERDEGFARCCLDVLDWNVEGEDDDGGGGGSGGEVTVCIVGLVHLDGIVEVCQREMEMEMKMENIALN